MDPQVEKSSVTIRHPYPYMEEEPADSDFLDLLVQIVPDETITLTGISVHYCRLCYAHLPAVQHQISGDDMVFWYPGGLLHYYLEHRVHPSPEFRRCVMSR